ncbi:MAG: histidine kinase [Gaiellaceae bacterium]
MNEVIERRRFERALHDGPQQDLIALAVQLQLAQSLVETDPVAANALLEELRRNVHAALGALQRIAAEIYPAVLDARGLAAALSGISRVRVRVIDRHPQALEASVYFCCVESDAEMDVSDDEGVVRISFRGPVSPRFRALAEAEGAVFYDSAR